MKLCAELEATEFKEKKIINWSIFVQFWKKWY